MKKKNQISPNECMLDELFKYSLFFEDGKYYLNNSISPLFIPQLRRAIKEDIPIRYFDPDVQYCPICGNKFNLNGTVKSKVNRLKDVRMQQYICSGSNCNETYYTKLKPENNHQFNIDIQEYSLKTGLINDMSLEKIAEMIEQFTGVKVSRQTILNHVKDNEDEFFKKQYEEINAELERRNIRPSGVYHYDEQYIFVNKELYLRLVIIDANTKMPIADDLIISDDFNKEYVKTFLNKSLKDLPLKGIVTDGVNYYQELIDELGVPHQICSFHKMQNFMSLIYKTINRNSLQIKRKEEKKEKLNNKIFELKTQQGPVSKGRINKNDNKRIKTHDKIKNIEKEIRKLNNEIKDYKKENNELNNDKKKLSRLFKSKTTETAEKRFNEFKNNMGGLHESTKTFINRLSKTFERVTSHIKNKFLPSTNNVIENYFGTTLPKLLKRKYRTVEGFKRRIKLSNIRWIKRIVLNSG
jgi:hypothetical protein